MTVSNYFQTFATARDRPRYVGMAVLKFFLSFMAGSAIYAVAVLGPMATLDIELWPAISWMWDTPEALTVGVLTELINDFSELLWDGRWIFLSVLAPAVPAALVYVELPEHTVDRYHKLGKYFVLFVTINFTLSAIFIANQFHFTADPIDWEILNVILYFSIASVFLPGPYIGTYIAVRWIDD